MNDNQQTKGLDTAAALKTAKQALTATTTAFAALHNGRVNQARESIRLARQELAKAEIECTDILEEIMTRHGVKPSEAEHLGVGEGDAGVRWRPTPRFRPAVS